jgi:hypothetical protein
MKKAFQPIMLGKDDAALLWSKVVSIAWTSFLTALFLLWSGNVVLKYIEAPTYLSIEEVDQKFADFPEVSFCLSKETSYKNDVLKVNLKTHE